MGFTTKIGCYFHIYISTYNVYNIIYSSSPLGLIFVGAFTVYVESIT